jgi:hypothetical protein
MYHARHLAESRHHSGAQSALTRYQLKLGIVYASYDQRLKDAVLDYRAREASELIFVKIPAWLGTDGAYLDGS